jgi:branched-chain amino acid transport system ATP-binding protein
MVPAHQGQILFKGRNIANIPTAQIVKAGISYVPEGRRIFPLLDVKENLEIGAYLRSDKKELVNDLDYVFSLFKKLYDRRKQLGGSLSGGEQQMLALGRALMGHPELLLMDEPSLGLAPILVDQIFDIIQSINKKGISIILVEQNAQMALNVAKYGLVIETGCIAVQGSANELKNNEQVKNSYLGM